MSEQASAETKDLEWEPTEEDREAYYRAVYDYMDECRAMNQSSCSGELGFIQPLWKWLQEAGLPLTAYAAEDFWRGERSQAEWISAKLLWASEGMPQPARRRMTLANMSSAQRRVWQQWIDAVDPPEEPTRLRRC